MAPRKPKSAAESDPEIDRDAEMDVPGATSNDDPDDLEDSDEEDEVSDFGNADDTPPPAETDNIDDAALTPEQRAAMYLLGEGGADQSRFKVNNQEEGYDYFHFMPTEMNDGDRERMRDRLHRQGFEPVNADPEDEFERVDSVEFVPAAPGAEIWKIKKAIARRYRTSRLNKAMESPLWVQAQAGRTQRNAILNATLKEVKRAKLKTPARMAEPKTASKKRELFGNTRGEAQRLQDQARAMKARVKQLSE